MDIGNIDLLTIIGQCYQKNKNITTDKVLLHALRNLGNFTINRGSTYSCPSWAVLI